LQTKTDKHNLISDEGGVESSGLPGIVATNCLPASESTKKVSLATRERGGKRLELQFLLPKDAAC
jgi:hypothetical protein